ncbi:hypothetical protein NDU88_002201 [Pleurodeles waltl]|uniref:Uncharacterized protein n=1 Tax=Pleurodeles waltl TaxID=8319 RepID=A0AAV7TLX3_PLEWA|nr:hypothetical protein NDU88_002201 [Pleurodeles waltl]
MVHLNRARNQHPTGCPPPVSCFSAPVSCASAFFSGRPLISLVRTAGDTRPCSRTRLSDPCPRVLRWEGLGTPHGSPERGPLRATRRNPSVIQE